jgi:putative ABC transport system permease protein
VRGSHRVLILSDQCWRQRFAAGRDVIGQTMTFDTGVWTIVGVMPPSFMYPAAATVPIDMWGPLPSQASDWVRGRSGKFDVQGVGRLKAGVLPARAQADLDRITAALRAESPQWFRNRGLTVTSMRDAIVGSARPWMLMLLGSVAFVLLLACVNVCNLLLARATTRARDAAVRSSLGASRWRILRGLLIESLLLSVTGTIIGVALATWGVQAIRAGLPARLPRLDEIAVNYRVLLAAAGVALAVALGVTPMWQTSPALSALGESGRSSGLGAIRSRARSVLLAAEAALAVVLLIGAGLFVSSFVRLLRVDLGFETAHVLSMDVSPPRGAKEPDFARVSAAIAGAGDRLRHVPGIESFALVSGTPPLMLGSDRKTVTVPGKPVFDNPEDFADAKLITADYFGVLRVPVIRGRAFSSEDAIAGAPATVILNDVAASRYFGQANPVGAAVLLDSSGARTVVGVVRSVRLFGPEGELRPEIYLPFDGQNFDGNPILTLLLRTSSDSSSIGPGVRDVVHAALTGRPTPTLETYDELFGKLVAQRKFNMIVLALFGVLAITIAGTGIYGVTAYVVEQRTQEIGVRMALGADRPRVIAMVLRDSMGTLIVGLGVGLAGGWGLSRFVRAFLFQDDGHNPAVYVAAALCLIGAGLLAAILPARRAARVDPVVALRAQ